MSLVSGTKDEIVKTMKKKKVVYCYWGMSVCKGVIEIKTERLNKEIISIDKQSITPNIRI